MIFPADNGKGIITDGTLYKLPHICTSNKDSCKKFYAEIQQPGLYECPHGFSVFVSECGIRVLGIAISGSCNIQRAKRNGYGYRVFQLLEVEACVSLHERIKELEDAQSQNETLIKELFHDVRKVNGTIKNNCQEALEKIDGESITKKSLLNILDAANLVTARLNYYSYIVNPSITDSRHAKSIYRLYEKSIQIFHDITIARNISFDIGQCWKTVQANDILEIVPFVILDNAIKYAPNDSRISIDFIENDSMTLTVRVTSYGPKLDEDEKEKIFLSGYRGCHVLASASAAGAGLGLSVVKSICDLHGYKVTASSGLSMKRMNNKNYWPFSISVTYCRVETAESRSSSPE